jgi:hypothetical protein
VATVAVMMRNLHILLSASAQIAPLGVVIILVEREKDKVNA